jgi:hypothetical protein
MSDSHLAKGPLFGAVASILVGAGIYYSPQVIGKAPAFAEYLTYVNYLAFAFGGLALVLLAISMLIGYRRSRSTDDEETYLTPQDELRALGNKIGAEEEAEAPKEKLSRKEAKAKKKQDAEQAKFDKDAKKDADKAAKKNAKARKKGKNLDDRDLLDATSGIRENQNGIMSIESGGDHSDFQKESSSSSTNGVTDTPLYDDGTKEPEWIDRAYTDPDFKIPFAGEGNGNTVPVTSTAPVIEQPESNTMPVVPVAPVAPVAPVIPVAPIVSAPVISVPMIGTEGFNIPDILKRPVAMRPLNESDIPTEVSERIAAFAEEMKVLIEQAIRSNYQGHSPEDYASKDAEVIQERNEVARLSKVVSDVEGQLNEMVKAQDSLSLASAMVERVKISAKLREARAIAVSSNDLAAVALLDTLLAESTHSPDQTRGSGN